MPAYLQGFGNASSIHGYGQEARQMLERARRQVAGMLSAKPEEVVFTGGGTEANNLALFGLVEAGKTHHFVGSAMEHPAVLNVLEELRGLGHAVTLLPVGEGGMVDPEDVRRSLRPETRAISAGDCGDRARGWGDCALRCSAGAGQDGDGCERAGSGFVEFVGA